MLVRTVGRYIAETYDMDIRNPDHDSLEGVMGQIYTDIFNPRLRESALLAFRTLIRVFSTRLATTTNDIRPTNKRLLYRIVARYLGDQRVDPGDLTIVTFNQDIQVEKILHSMSDVPRWASLSSRIFNFPGLYRIGVPPSRVTSPTTGGEASAFPEQDREDGCIRLLKLHGSLNWYSAHVSREPSANAMFKPTRDIYITRRLTIDPNMALSSTVRNLYTLPVIVPPVSHKSAVLHNEMAEIWRLSEECLASADELVIFGYSCPALDFESSNQLRRSQMSRVVQPSIHVIDPQPAVTTRYIGLLGAKRLSYYASAHDFLAD